MVVDGNPWLLDSSRLPCLGFCVFLFLLLKCLGGEAHGYHCIQSYDGHVTTLYVISLNTTLSTYRRDCQFLVHFHGKQINFNL